MLYAELVCQGCRRVLRHPFSAVSCRCSYCLQLTPAQYATYECQGCQSSIIVPINTLTSLCPVCATITEIPEEMLPLNLKDGLTGCGGGLLPENDVEQRQRQTRLREKNIFVFYDEPQKANKNREGDTVTQCRDRSEVKGTDESEGALRSVMLIGKKIV